MVKAGKEAVEISELLATLFHEHKRRMMSLAKDYGLTAQQTSTLWLLEQKQTLAMSELAEMLMCDASNVTGIVDKLETRGLTQRVVGEDRRVKMLTLTAAGKKHCEEFHDRLFEPPEWLLKLTKEEQRSLRELLRRAVDSVPGE
ncbi:MAG TPA: MarR family transcriptional regulator [Polyangiales bacterium]|nr:MarR family transcriptional regulator [Polyangiales bacterium]